MLAGHKEDPAVFITLEQGKVGPMIHRPAYVQQDAIGIDVQGVVVVTMDSTGFFHPLPLDVSHFFNFGGSFVGVDVVRFLSPGEGAVGQPDLHRGILGKQIGLGQPGGQAHQPGDPTQNRYGKSRREEAEDGACKPDGVGDGGVVVLRQIFGEVGQGYAHVHQVSDEVEIFGDLSQYFGGSCGLCGLGCTPFPQRTLHCALCATLPRLRKRLHRTLNIHYRGRQLEKPGGQRGEQFPIPVVVLVAGKGFEGFGEIMDFDQPEKPGDAGGDGLFVTQVAQ